ncbi:MAG: hypothetical protein HY040_12780 [Planctomycetes bacterium]|nr:hypothetical protein [Planctomycetota bacterium]
MKTRLSLVSFVLWGIALVFAGCAEQEPEPKPKNEPAQPKAEAKKVEVGKNVYLELQGDQRRVLIQAYVCLRKGQLEQLLTRKRGKEHEAILAADIDASDIHTALLATGAEPGKPVQFVPKFQPPSGAAIKVSLEYEDKGKKIRRPASEWLRNVKTQKDLEHDWVFAGSRLFPDPEDNTKKPFYAANDGDVICVSNFDTALLDLPIDSSKDNDELSFEANTERIPEVETRVLVILEPVLAKPVLAKPVLPKPVLPKKAK